MQNHDQIGNRADATRISERIEPAALDFLHFVKFFAPQIPLCFMGDEANIDSPFPYFFDLPEGAARPKREGRYDQMRDLFHEQIERGDLPDPNDPATFQSAKLPWDDYARPERRAALDRFRQLAAWRRERLWPLAATKCTDARTARQGNCLIITWQFRAGALTMALNPTPAPADLSCVITGASVSTGSFSQDGEVLSLDRWSAVAWKS